MSTTTAPRKTSYDWLMSYSKSGLHWRWRLFSFGVQVGTGTTKTVKAGRVEARNRKAEYIKEQEGA